MNNDFLFLMKHEGGFGVPGRITTPTDAVKDVVLIFDRDFAESSFGGGVSAENGRAVACVRTSEIGGLTLTNAGNSAGNTAVAIDDLWEDDNGNPVLNEDDEAVYAANVFEYVIKSTFKDANGVVQMELTEA